MIKGLVKRGNSYSLTLDQAILQLMKAEGTSMFELTLNGEELRIRPVRGVTKMARAEAIADEVMETQKDVFEKLAK